MPTYSYRCKECGHILEAFQSITAEPLKKCPNCGKEALERYFAGRDTTLIFKGSGFYVTDYGKSKSCPKDKCSTCPKNKK